LTYNQISEPVNHKTLFEVAAGNLLNVGAGDFIGEVDQSRFARKHRDTALGLRMKTTVRTEINVFIASPQDVKAERDAACLIIAEINDSFLRGKDYQLKVTRSEEGTYAAYGYDPQFIINQQIAEDFDAVLVMFWHRIGTKTPREISGTVEELRRAEKQHKKTGRPQIMIYFKTAVIHPFNSDLKQLEHVRKIRTLVSKKAYYKEFADESEFSKTFKNGMVQWLEKEILGKPHQVKRWSPAAPPHFVQGENPFA
jgi:hypothetical protein